MIVRGIVTDGSERVPSAHVYVSNSEGVLDQSLNVATTTNLNGEYSLNVPDNSYLTMSFVGQKQTVKVDGKSEINFKVGGTLLDEFTVTAKGWSLKKKLIVIGGSSLALIGIAYLIKKKLL